MMSNGSEPKPDYEALTDELYVSPWTVVEGQGNEV